MRFGTTSARRATSQTEAPGANASATIDRFCSVLQRRRRSRLDSTSIWVIAPSLAPVQTTVLAPMPTKTDHSPAHKAAASGRLRDTGDHGSINGPLQDLWENVGIQVITFLPLPYIS